MSTGSSTRSAGNSPPTLIVQLPVPVRQKLCEHLDSLDVWRKLATFVGLYAQDVQYIQSLSQRGQSPTNEFLNIWGGQYNHTVRSLFALLQQHKLRNAMLILKDYVDPKLHKFIPKTEAVQSKMPSPPSTRSNNNSTTPGVTHDSYNTNSIESPGDIRVSSVIRVAQSLLMIDYDELVEATNNWSPENKLGHGGFGEVFKGEFKNTEVAIKAMNYKHEHMNKRQVNLQQSYNEMKHLNNLRHDNILALYGYSINGEKYCLVYQLMKGGSLDSRLRAKSPMPPLTWQQRLTIALGTARGIYFLHSAPEMPLIHGDIKPANILLDYCLHPKLGDFGLARKGPKSINAVTEVNKLFGTKIYLPPELLSNKMLSTGVDIYSFGVVLLEMFSGRLMAECKLESDQINLLKKVKKSCERSLENRHDLFDKHLATPMGEELDSCLCAIETGVKCADSVAQKRPSMDQVVKIFKTFSNEP